MPTVTRMLSVWLCDKRHTPSFADAKSAAVRVVADLGGLDVADLTPPVIVRWLGSLTDRAPNRRRGYLWALRGAIQAAMLEGVIDHDPSRGLPRSALPPKRVRPEYRAAELVLTASDVRALLEAAPSSRRTQWAVVLLAGLRVGEASALRWGDVRPDEPLDCLSVSRSWSTKRREMGPTKTGAVRRVPVHTALAAMLRAHRATWLSLRARVPRADDLIFPGRREDRPMGEPVWLAHWKADLARIGLSPRPIHSARHTFLSLAIEHGASESAIFACTHGDSSIRGVYRHWQWPSLCEAVSRIPIDWAPPPSIIRRLEQ